MQRATVTKLIYRLENATKTQSRWRRYRKFARTILARGWIGYTGIQYGGSIAEKGKGRAIQAEERKLGETQQPLRNKRDTELKQRVTGPAYVSITSWVICYIERRMDRSVIREWLELRKERISSLFFVIIKKLVEILIKLISLSCVSKGTDVFLFGKN